MNLDQGIDYLERNLAEAGYPSGYTADIPLDLYKGASGSETEIATFAESLFQIGIKINTKR
ncbi:MAG: hypothetical protein JSU67_13825 [Gammaproteobacteria bacterium]|nr:MAG: hypothetical protein JSU67_13825 [Gammaproteobacteria bacterium]